MPPKSIQPHSTLTSSCSNNKKKEKPKSSEPLPSSNTIHWPTLLFKTVSSDWILDQQIVLIRNVLTKKECQSIVSLFSSTITMMIPSAPAKKGEAKRTHSRFSIQDASFAHHLYQSSGIQQLVQEDKELVKWIESDGRKPCGFLSNIRVYCYQPMESFDPHYDSHLIQDGNRTEWTVLIYLTGQEDGIVDGQTVFYHHHSKNFKSTVSPILAPLERGMALLHRHGNSVQSGLHVT